MVMTDADSCVLHLHQVQTAAGCPPVAPASEDGRPGGQLDARR